MTTSSVLLPLPFALAPFIAVLLPADDDAPFGLTSDAAESSVALTVALSKTRCALRACRFPTLAPLLSTEPVARVSSPLSLSPPPPLCPSDVPVLLDPAGLADRVYPCPRPPASCSSLLREPIPPGGFRRGSLSPVDRITARTPVMGVCAMRICFQRVALDWTEGSGDSRIISGRLEIYHIRHSAVAVK